MKKRDLYKKCTRYPVITFDIFDTLLKRDVFSPHDVHRLVEIQYDKSVGGRSGFAAKRIEAEKKARENSEHDEVTIEEIYDMLDCPPEEKEALLSLEMATEQALLHANPDILPLYRKCVGDGKRIYIISDMYLPREFLERVLKREGITGYAKLFLSADYRKQKKSGALFKVFCNETETPPKDVLHIGDSWYADYIGPRRLGMNAVHIPRRPRNTLYSDLPNETASVDERSLYAFVNSRITSLSDRNEQLGYEVLGPLICAYCQWIHDRLEEQGNDVIAWFAARDMYVFKKAYDRLYGPCERIKYAYISRKSLRPAYSDAMESIGKSGEVFARGKYSIRQIVEYMGYSLSDVDAGAMSGIGLDDKLYDSRKLENYDEVKRILESNAIAEKERTAAELAKRYLKAAELYDNDVVLVDVGWHGTTQYILNGIQHKDDKAHSVYGLYLGCLDGTIDKIGKNGYQAFLFDEHDDCDFMKGIILFECLILAPHGSTKGYRLSEDGIEPVLGIPETAAPVIASIQKGARQFVDDYCDSVLCRTISLDPEGVKRPFERMTTRPDRREIISIGDLDYDNFYCSKMAAPKGLLYYMLHRRAFFNDLKYSPWRIGFLYRLFRIRFPYAKVYSALRRRRGKLT